MGNWGEQGKDPVRRATVRMAMAVGVVAVMLAATSCIRPRPGTTTTTTRPAPTSTTGPGPTTTAPPSGGGGPGPAVGWNPPAEYVQPLAEVWNYTIGRQRQWQTFRNFEWDQILNGKGTLSYCVRWESNQAITTAQRDRIAVVLEQQYNKWMQAMTENGKGWNGWPYTHVNVRIVGWAVRNRSLAQWTDASVPVYAGLNDAGGAPMCPASAKASLSLWLTPGMNGGTGGDWGQRVGLEYFLGALSSSDIHILLHEIGHGFGLEDFYEWSPNVCCFVMKAGSAMKITEFDKWMLRDWWRHLKPRYQL